MSLELIQDVIATGVAAGAAAVIVRRAFAFVSPTKTEPTCSSCPSRGKHSPYSQQRMSPTSPAAEPRVIQITRRQS